MRYERYKVIASRAFAIICFFLSLGLTRCSDDDSPPVISAEAESFLNEVLRIMEQNSINRNVIDWQDFRAKVFDTVTGAKTIEDTYPGIHLALSMLADNHSFFLKADGTGIFAGTIRCQNSSILTPVLPEHIGYVKVEGFSGSETEATDFANDIQDQIKMQDHEDLEGWIVDLRGNGGGNMWPMIAGIGPILGEGTAGYFVNPDGLEYPWGYRLGASISNGTVITQVIEPYELLAPEPRVAVLLDNGIASSGEVVAISFIGRAKTKSFGSSTCGLSTSNSGYGLSHNCKLVLTTSHLADRTKKTYGMPIDPDQISSSQTIIQDAVEWLTQ